MEYTAWCVCVCVSKGERGIARDLVVVVKSLSSHSTERRITGCCVGIRCGAPLEVIQCRVICVARTRDCMCVGGIERVKQVEGSEREGEGDRGEEEEDDDL